MKQPTDKFTESDLLTSDGWVLKAYHHGKNDSVFAPILAFHAMSLCAHTHRYNCRIWKFVKLGKHYIYVQNNANTAIATGIYTQPGGVG